MAAANDQILNKYGGLIAGGIVLILFAYVISVFVVYGIEKEKTTIGASYALGVNRNQLMLHYLCHPVVVSFLAGAIGCMIGFASIGDSTIMGSCYEYFSIPNMESVYPPYLIVYDADGSNDDGCFFFDFCGSDVSDDEGYDSPLCVSHIHGQGVRLQDKGIKKLYLDGNFYVIAVGAAICIPLAKKCMNLMYPLMVSNVNCGMNLHYPWRMYAIEYVAVLVLYFVMNGLLTSKLKKINLAEVLKNRVILLKK